MPALTAGLATLVVVHPSWTLLAITLYWLGRLLSTRESRLLIRTFTVLLITVGCAGFFIHTCYSRTPKGPQKVSEHYLVWPDQVQVNGDLVLAEGREIASHHKVQLSWRAKSQSEVRTWQKLVQPVMLSATGQKQPLALATNENQFNPRQYNYARRICAELRVESIKDVQQVTDHSPLAVCHQWRARAHRYFQSLPSPLSEYADQLLIGYRGTNSDWQTAVKQLGIIHLFCLSGMHVVLLCELTRRLMVLCRWTRESIDIVLALLLPCYLILGGGSAGLIRAVIMAECRLWGSVAKLNSLDAWSWSLILGCWLDPLVLTSLGGQLSYLLSLLLQLVEQGEFLRTILLNLAGLPLILNGVYEIHLASFVMSYLISPIFALVLFPGTIISAGLSFFWKWPATVFSKLLAVFHHFLISCTHLPGMICFGKPPEWAVWLLLVLSLLTLDQPAVKQNYLSLGCAYCLIFVMIHFPLTGEVTFVDVGQGDSMIIRTPFNRHVVMIDTGGRLAFRRPRWAQMTGQRAPAEKTSLNYLKSIGINQLDAVFLSHSDADHIGDIPTVIHQMKVRRIYVPVGMEKMTKFRRYLPNDSQVSVLPVQSGDVCEDLFQVVHPRKSGQGGNGDSLTLFGCFGGLRFLFTGDLDQAGEKKVLKQYPDLKLDVLKLGHHGSRTASSPEFLAATRPTIGIISAGRFNRYGHPHNVTMKHLAEQRITPMSTQQYGMIKYRYFGQHGRWQTTLRGDELRWMLPPYSNS